MRITIIILLVVSSLHISRAHKDVLEIGTSLYEIVHKLANVTTNSDTPELKIAEMNDRNTSVGRLLGQLLKEVIGIENSGNSTSDVPHNAITLSPYGYDTHPRILELITKMTIVDSKFKQFQSLLTGSTTAEEWKSFAKQALDINDKLDSIICGLYHKDLPLIIANVLSHPNHCKAVSSIQILLREFLQALIITEIKGLTILTYANIIQYSWINGRHIGLHFNIEVNSKKRFMNYLRYFATYMNSIPKDQMPCDHHNGPWIRDETYFEIEGIEQAVIFHYKSKNQGFLRSKGCHAAMKRKLVEYDSKQDICSGMLSDCQYSAWLEVCRLENNTKRYEWIKAANGNYGMNIGQCPNGHVTNYKGISDWFKSHCICKCRDEFERNWISLDPVMTNVTENMVISGLRFVRKNKILLMQIQQAKLLANGLLDKNSYDWVPLPINPKLVAITAINSKFYLDDVILPDNYLAIGVEFNDNNGFSIAVTGQKFNFSTGRLLSDSLKKVLDHANYKQLILPPRNSIYANLTHEPDSNRNWVQLKMSDLKLDAGQSTLPLFDAMIVKSSLPLEGIGIVHRGVENYAGFISPRLFPLQYRKHLFDFIEKHALDREH